jgi:hypothetical protein
MNYNDNPYIRDNQDAEVNEEAIWRDAWKIADPGASNPVAVARSLFYASSALLRNIGTDAVKAHPALQVMAGQLSSLYRTSSLGAEDEAYTLVHAAVLSLDGSDKIKCVKCSRRIHFCEFTWVDGTEHSECVEGVHRPENING